jgi:cyclase
MLKARIMPTLLWKDFGLVKGEGFDSWRRTGTVMPAIKVYNRREVDELVLLDISASGEGRDPDYESVAEFAAECFVPLTVGGGIHSLEQIKQLLRAGADKVTVNTAAYRNPSLISDIAQRFGSQCVVASIDVKRHPDGGYECFSLSGKHAEGRDPIRWAQAVERMGAGEILLTSIERDGLMQGYDLELIQQVAQAVNIPVIASGGAGDYEDFYLALTTAGASAAAAASIFQFTEQTPLEAKQYLQAKGLPVRNSCVEKGPV